MELAMELLKGCHGRIGGLVHEYLAPHRWPWTRLQRIVYQTADSIGIKYPYARHCENLLSWFIRAGHVEDRHRLVFNIEPDALTFTGIINLRKWLAQIPHVAVEAYKFQETYLRHLMN